MTHILVVDDDAHIRELVGLFLIREGFEVTQERTASRHSRRWRIILPILSSSMS